MKKAVIAGASGFLGQALLDEFGKNGYECVALARGGKAVRGAARTEDWDGRHVGLWARELEGADVVINLSGANLLKHWTEEYKQQIVQSRVQSTHAIGEAVAGARTPPLVWINASAVGWYGDTGDKPVDESGRLGDDFLAHICKQWEAAVDHRHLPETRTVKMRIGLPLGLQGGAFPGLLRATRLFVGSALGNGSQYMPWIHIDDLTAAFRWCVDHPLDGPVNCVGPKPVRNSVFMSKLRKIVGRPWVPPVPSFVLKAIGLVGPPLDLALVSSRVMPRALMDSGFPFKHMDVQSAVRDLLRR